MSRHRDTIAALATPIGTAAIAVVRASGPDTAQIAEALLGATPPPRVARHADYRDRDGQLLDDVVATFYRGPHSYTGEDALEISCHGNPFIAQKILEDLFARGCRPAEAGEFTQRAFLNGRMDLSQAEAVMDVIHARSERALAAANQQLRGALGRRMTGMVDVLLGVLARIEAYIDFPEEDLPPEDRSAVLADLVALEAATRSLLATSHYGELLRDGFKVVIVGEPNVGKSSLLNRLVGSERALVSPEPGTTRDFIEERIRVGPHWVRLIDTAGLNPCPAPLERLGMEKTRAQAAEADLLLRVFDASRLGPRSPAFDAKEGNVPFLNVFNKSDLCPSPASLGSAFPDGAVLVSALTGSGIEELLQSINEHADALRPTLGDEVIAINARHARSLQDAQRALAAARAKLADNGPVELVASELREVLGAFGEITGRVDNERMLDQLFATFCIGK